MQLAYRADAFLIFVWGNLLIPPLGKQLAFPANTRFSNPLRFLQNFPMILYIATCDTIIN